MKKLISLVLALVMIFSIMTVESFAAAKSSSQNLTVNGEDVKCEKYNIDGSNYFKLRDIAMLLNGTKSQFEVGWDSATSTISISTSSPYTTVGGELEIRGDMSSKAKKSSQALLIDGERVTGLSVYNIGGNNFFKLRDLGDALGFNVDFDAATNTAVVESADTNFVPSSATDVQIMGLPKGYAYIESPKTRTDFLHNAIYAMATGNYDFKYTGTLVEDAYNFDVIKFTLGGIFSVYDNQRPINIVCVDGTYSLIYSGVDGLTKSQIGKNSVAAVAAAKSIYKKLHTNGTISDGMSQVKIAQAYSDYLYSLNVTGTTSWMNKAYDAKTMNYDSAYACLVNKKADCAGRAAAFELLMHLEGIPCTSLSCTASGSGHVLNYVLLDGQDYLCDWFNRDTLSPYFATVSSFDKSVITTKDEDYDYLECAKALAKAYKNNSVKDFDATLIKYATDVIHGDAAEQNYYYTDSITKSFSCNGNVNVEYIGSGRFKLTPKQGKIVYNEKNYTVFTGDQYYFTDIGKTGKNWAGNIIGGSRVVFDNGSVILNMADHKEVIMKGSNYKVREDGINRCLTNGFEVTFISGKTTYHAVCTPK